MKLHLTKELENLINSRGGEKYILKCIMDMVGNKEMISLYEYNYICHMKVSVYDQCALWKDGCSPIEKLFGKSYNEIMYFNKKEEK